MNRVLGIGSPMSKVVQLGLDPNPFHWDFTPDIPSPGDVLRYFADLFTHAYTDLLAHSLQALQVFGTPSPAVITSDWYSYWVGTWYGVSYRLMSLMVILVALIFVFTPWARHERKFGSTVTSMLGIAVFGAAFYPLTGILIDLSHAFTGWIALWATGQDGPSSSDQLAELMAGAISPQNVLGMLASSFINMVIWFFVLTVCIYVQLCTLLALGFYPIGIILRPIPRVGETVFSLLNGLIITGFFAGPVLAAELALGMFFIKQIQRSAPEISGLTSPAISIALGIIMFISPIFMTMMTYRKTMEMSGNATSFVEDGALKVTVDDPVSVKQAQRAVHRQPSIPGELLKASIVATVDDVKGESLVRRAVDIGAQTAMATGHAEAAFALQVVKRKLPVPTQGTGQQPRPRQTPQPRPSGGEA
jgi:hypothetical protein